MRKRKNLFRIEKKDIQIRVSPNLVDKLINARVKRGENRLDKDPRVLSDRELTKMLVNTPSFPKVMEELITLPRKEDLR